MSTLTANDLKTRGVTAIEESLAQRPEAVISVRGRDRFVVMEMAQYQYLRECELEAALVQTQAEVAAGHYVVETAQEHVARMQALLAPESRSVAPTPATKKRAASGTAARTPASRGRPGRGR